MLNQQHSRLKKTTILLFMYLFSHINNYAQDEVIFPSPNAAEISRFGTVPVGLFTGTMQYDIPLYELGNSNLSVPISLQYSSNGFVVDKTASTVGYDWNLNAGGVITQYVHGASSINGSGMDYSTYLLTGRSDKEKYYFLENYDPVDNFFFTFPGYSGSFYIDNVGNAVILKKTDNLSISYNFNNGASQFVITTPDGTRYIFADCLSSYTQNFNSWYLSSIQHPSGDHIDFTYSDEKINMTDVAKREVYHAIGDNDKPLPSPNSKEEITTIPTVDRYLERIDFEGVGSVVFTNTYNRTDSQGVPKVDKITVLNADGNTEKSFNLKYLFPQCNTQYDLDLEYPNNTTYHKYRMFLDKVEVNHSGGNKEYYYDFDYNDINNLPPRNSYSKDFWGYFNGKLNDDILNVNDYQWIIDKFSIDEFNYFKLVFNFTMGDLCDRSANHSFSQKGMLNHITYPTGGYSEIEYEAHRNETNEEVGGCRVSKIKTYTLNSPTPEVKVYNYTQVTTNYNEINYNRTEAYVLHPFQYTVGCLELDPHNKTAYWLQLSPDLQNNFSTGGYHLCYGNVEIQQGANGENGSEKHEFRAIPQQLPVPINGPLVYTPLKRSNTDLFNGIPIRITYKKNNVLQKEIVYDYDFNNTKYQIYLTCNSIYHVPEDLEILRLQTPEFGGPWCTGLTEGENLPFIDVSEYRLYSNFPYLESKKETITDDNGNAVVTETFYDYCDAPYTNIRSVTTKMSNGKTLKRVYKYPFDRPTQAPYNNMVTNKTTSPVIEQQEYVLDNGQTFLKSVVSTDYSEIKPGLYLPVSVYRLDNPNLMASGTYTTYDNGLITRGTSFSLEKQLKYDTRSNIIEVQSKDEIPTSYIWGYGGMYPIAKVENANTTKIAYTSFESEDQDGGWSFEYEDPVMANAEAQLNCDGTCTNAAQASCSNTCQASCNGNPDCYNSCMQSCTAGVYGSCMSNCVNAQAQMLLTIDTGVSKTGVQSFVGQSVSKSDLPSGFYTVSYWAKKKGTSNGSVTVNGLPATISNSDWEYHEYITSSAVTSVSVIPSGVYIDELRLCPSDAQMETYTYKPLYGISSQTDPNGKTTYYDYDTFGRLQFIKDDQGKILKKYDYHYATQNP